MQNPLSILPTRLLPWFAQNARPLPWRQDRRPYHVWLSEIMLQQTRVEAVWNYYLRFLAALPTVEDLAAAEEDKLLKLWEGLGYYNRARNLQKCARVIVNDLHGEFPTDYDGWLALPGIGPYTAGAVASICFDCPVAAVDGNVLRVITRFTENAAPIDLQTTKARIKADLEQVYPAGACGTFTQALMELGACVCTPKSPKCSVCPLGDVCAANTSGSQTDFPVKLPKRAKRHQNRTVFFLTCGDRVALSKRGDKGLLSGLWQLPDTDGFERGVCHCLLAKCWFGAAGIAKDRTCKPCFHAYSLGYALLLYNRAGDRRELHLGAAGGSAAGLCVAYGLSPIF